MNETVPKRFVRTRTLCGQRFWYLFDEGDSEGIVSLNARTLWSIATHHAREPLPRDNYGWSSLLPEVRR